MGAGGHGSQGRGLGNCLICKKPTNLKLTRFGPTKKFKLYCSFLCESKKHYPNRKKWSSLNSTKVSLYSKKSREKRWAKKENRINLYARRFLNRSLGIKKQDLDAGKVYDDCVKIVSLMLITKGAVNARKHKRGTGSQ